MDRICRFWKPGFWGSQGEPGLVQPGARRNSCLRQLPAPLAACQAIECCAVPSPNLFDRLHVVLVAARNPLNIGAAARAMSNFGFRSLRVVNPYEPSFREARSAVGASEILEKAELFSGVAQAVADCTLVVGTTAVRNRELQHPVHRPEYAARAIRKRLGSGRVALLFGSEKFGLSNEDLSHCHWLIRIPTCDENISMNLGQAVAVCLYELIRDSKSERAPGRPDPAPSAEIERITRLLLELLHTSGFFDRRRINDSEDRIRRLVRRLHLQERDAVIWLGMLRQMLWKMTAGKDVNLTAPAAPVIAGRRKKTATAAPTPRQESPK
jgi:TrmH family RNA methyltransferase